MPLNKVILEELTGEIVEKKSRFIATLRPVKTEEEAVDFIREMKKKYWNARHNCWAYVIGEEGRIKKASDDGEPSRTAGLPMMEILEGQGLFNICAVVTRYFGGTLLGTGGLIRAYQGALRGALAPESMVEAESGIRLSLGLRYDLFGRVKSLAEREGLILADTLYTQEVTLALILPVQREREILDKITEETGGNARIVQREAIRYGCLASGWMEI